MFASQIIIIWVSNSNQSDYIFIYKAVFHWYQFSPLIYRRFKDYSFYLEILSVGKFY